LSLARALSSRPASHLPVLPVRKLLHRHRKVFNQRGIIHVHNSGGRVPAPSVSETSCGGVAATRVPTSIANLTALTSLDLAATASERGGARCSRASSASPASRLELTSSSWRDEFPPAKECFGRLAKGEYRRAPTESTALLFVATATWQCAWVGGDARRGCSRRSRAVPPAWQVCRLSTYGFTINCCSPCGHGTSWAAPHTFRCAYV
jgi:hypothetical protein